MLLVRFLIIDLSQKLYYYCHCYRLFGATPHCTNNVGGMVTQTTPQMTTQSYLHEVTGLQAACATTAVATCLHTDLSDNHKGCALM